MLYLKSLIVFFMIVLAEICNGICRMKFLAPLFKDLKSRQLSVFTGCVNISIITLLTQSWVGARSEGEQIQVGILWLLLMFVFELSFGRFYMRMPWRKIFLDFNIFKGRLLAVGMLFLALAPWLHFKVRLE